jgi:hypothetical protein
LSELRDKGFCQGIVFVPRHQHADAPHSLGLLRPRPAAGPRPKRWTILDLTPTLGIP